MAAGWRGHLGVYGGKTEARPRQQTGAKADCTEVFRVELEKPGIDFCCDSYSLGCLGNRSCIWIRYTNR